MPDYYFAATDRDYAEAAILFKEYATWLNIDLGFQHFEEELQQLRSMYAKPFGGIILCRNGLEYIACAGIRKIDAENAELKRMFVKEAFRGKNIGSTLLKMALQLAKDCGYKKVKLDTLNSMLPAMELYKKYGFKEIPAYYHNPNPTAVYFEIIL
ncbi:MAG: GNAT family N-acetyltransferase [Ferruginibacter sp.]